MMRWMVVAVMLVPTLAWARKAVPCAPVRSVDTGNNGIHALVVPADGKTFVAGGEDGTVRIYDLKSGRPGKVLKGQALFVVYIPFATEKSTGLSSLGRGKGAYRT